MRLGLKLGAYRLRDKVTNRDTQYSPDLPIVHPPIVHDCLIVHFFRKFYETGKKSFWFARQN